MLGHPDTPADWRRELKTKIAWTLVMKLLALTLLWFFFFRDSHP